MKPSMRDWAKEPAKRWTFGSAMKKIERILFVGECQYGQYPAGIVVQGNIIK